MSRAAPPLVIAAAVVLASVAAFAVTATPSTPASSDPATALALQAAAATADAGHGQILFLKHCVPCHGARGWGDGPRVIPAIAGQQERYLVVQLARFATGERHGSDIHGSAMHDTLQPADVDRPQALADLAAWLARAPRDREPEQGEGRDLAAAGRTYLRDCAECHGTNGAGDARAAVPALAGQHYSYLLAQLQAFAAGRRTHVLFADSSTTPSAQQQQALADYLSRLILPGSGP
ncbi:MAG TPA: c-type cytochrome [Steroidobacteraceae bacterium]|nr:c-type cytochrome [Steroidobacteraceae bacterium]